MLGSARSRLSLITATAVAAGIATAVAGAPASATPSSAVSGTAFQDSNRNGVRDAGEPGFAGIHVRLYNASGVTLVTTTDSNGAFSFSGLSDGTYTEEIDSADWSNLRDSWVPSTVTGLTPRRTVTLSGTADGSIGLRAIVRSGTAGAPISHVTGANGLTVESYDDVITAQQLYNDLVGGYLIGAEAADVTVRFDLGSTSVTNSSVQGTPGNYSGYAAVSYVAYDSWLDQGDATLFHEYGHAWSMYFAYLVQQDASWSGYLHARGLASDPRVGTSYEWDPREMIAEDYRQLFGSGNAQAAAQMNPDIPSAASVAGLQNYLSTTFRTASTQGSSSTGTTTAPAVTVTGLAVSPTPVVKSGTVSFRESAAATVTVRITSNGATVRTLINTKSEPAGTVSVGWDRKNDAGRRVNSGTYVVTVSATDAGGNTANSQLSFQVS